MLLPDIPVIVLQMDGIAVEAVTFLVIEAGVSR